MLERNTRFWWVSRVDVSKHTLDQVWLNKQRQLFFMRRQALADPRQHKRYQLYGMIWYGHLRLTYIIIP